jgi:uncharacterized membrane protein
MDAILNVLGGLPSAVTTYWVQIILAVSLLSILAIIFFIGWKINRKEPFRISEFLNDLKVRYSRGEISEKEYGDVQREMKEAVILVKNYMEIYKN